jgi:hypothetical protein
MKAKERKWQWNARIFGSISVGMVSTGIMMHVLTGASYGTSLAFYLAASFAGASIGSIAYARRLVTRFV